MSSVIQDFYSTITKSGTQAILQAGTLGPRIDITGFRIGARSAAQGAVANKEDLDVDDFVYQGDATRISYQVLPDANACLFQIVLDENVGDFQVGQIGLMVGSTMFSKSVLYRPENKWKSALPGRFGNTMVFNIILYISDAESCINLTILRPLYSSLPEVPTENDLPPAISSLYNTYVVRNHTKTGSMTLASRRNNTWNFATQRLYAGNGETIMPVGASAFDSSVKINMSVYYDWATEKFLPADNSDPAKLPVGIRTSDFEVMIAGIAHRYQTDDIWPPALDIGDMYYTGTAANAGRPVLTPVSTAVYGFPVSNDTVYFDFSRNLQAANLVANPPTVVTIINDRTHRHDNATTTTDGFMSAADKVKLDAFSIGKASLV